MAKKHPNTNKSQFYIIYEKQPQLNNVDTVIGKVIYGMDILNNMIYLKIFIELVIKVILIIILVVF